MKILIIGGTGLISTAITRQLLERGDEVTLFNRGRTAPRIPSGARILHGDRQDFPAFETQIAAAGTFDAAIDMVCYHPAEAESALRALRSRTGHFIFCSTCSVYSRPASRYPITEDESRNPIGSYGREKAACEDIFTAAHARAELKVTILRPAFTYGEGRGLPSALKWGTAFLDRLRRGKPVISPGDGTALRAYCYMDDVARAFTHAAGNPNVFGRTFHVPGDDWLTWDGYFHAVAAALGAPAPRLVHIPSDLLGRWYPQQTEELLTNNMWVNIPDNTPAKKALGFNPSVPFTEGVSRTIAWLERNGLIEDSSRDPWEDQVIARWQTLLEG
jgi:nucleoside-diphosphate-sugar epimerase